MSTYKASEADFELARGTITVETFFKINCINLSSRLITVHIKIMTI